MGRFCHLCVCLSKCILGVQSTCEQVSDAQEIRYSRRSRLSLSLCAVGGTRTHTLVLLVTMPFGTGYGGSRPTVFCDTCSCFSLRALAHTHTHTRDKWKTPPCHTSQRRFWLAASCQSRTICSCFRPFCLASWSFRLSGRQSAAAGGRSRRASRHANANVEAKGRAARPGCLLTCRLRRGPITVQSLTQHHLQRACGWQLWWCSGALWWPWSAL